MQEVLKAFPRSTYSLAMEACLQTDFYSATPSFHCNSVFEYFPVVVNRPTA